MTTPQLMRASALREAGLSYSSIAKVMRLDCGADFSETKIRYYLGRYVPTTRKKPHGRPFKGKVAA